MKPEIYLATDHAGFLHKNSVRDWLMNEGYFVVDCGAYTLDPTDDFPDFIKNAAKAVSREPSRRRAILFGGSGQGEAMVANRHRRVRAAVYYGKVKEIVKLSREHNDANILSLGARFMSIDEAKEVIWMWLHTVPLKDPKYARRNAKIGSLTDRLYNLVK